MFKLDRYKDIHSRGIIHNGIKPGNICLPPQDPRTDASQLYVIDFGLSFLLNVADSDFLPSAHRADTVGNRSYLSVLGHHGISMYTSHDPEIYEERLIFLKPNHSVMIWSP